ncbi:MAG: insulinase family protein [Candidatus Eiseniibacteriota bacterium]|nr:MAG: insulinase family protein [Candidatus Eisenbacteria bacterium]
MKRTVEMISPSIILLLLVSLPALALGAELNVEKLKYPKLNEIVMPEVQEITLPNGMTVMLVEDHELPLVKMKALIRAGTVYEPTGMAGLTEMFGEAWRTGGTASWTGDEIDEILESIGATIEGGIGEGSATLSANTMTESFDQVLDIFREILMTPVFSEDKVDLARTRLSSIVSRRNDEPMSILMREYRKLIYGPASPYARQYEYEGLNKLAREDMLEFHGRYFHPNAVILGVWGDFKTSDMKKKLEQSFAEWNSADIDYPEVAEVDLTLRPSVNYAEKKDIEQCFVLTGHLCMRLDDPDYPEFYVMSEILGGGWTSRIFKKVRTELGLAYGAGGGLMSRYDYPGPFYTFCSTKFASTHQAISAMLDEVKRIRETEVTDAELALAKESYLNSFAFNFDSVGKILSRLMTYRYHGYPPDFLQKTRAAIENVTKQDVLRVARERLHPDKLVILAVGDAERFDKPLSSFGAVTTLDISIPEPGEAVPEPTEASAEKGDEIMQKALAAMGGAERVLSLNSISSVLTASMSTPAGDMTIDMTLVLVYPDRFRLDMQTPMGAVVQTLDGDSGWMSTPQGVMALQGSQAAELKKMVRFELFSVLKAFVRGEAEIQYLGDTQLDGHDVFELLVSLGDDASSRMFVDKKDYTIVGNSRRANTMEGPAEITEILSDFRDVEGLKVSFASAQRAGDKEVSSSSISEFKINPEVDLSIFAKPE